MYDLHHNVYTAHDFCLFFFYVIYLYGDMCELVTCVNAND